MASPPTTASEAIGSVRAVRGRIEAALNKELAAIIPVVYGALLSYAMYVFAQLIVDLVRFTPPALGSAQVGISPQQFWPAAVLFLCMIFFVAEDLGEIVKLAKICEFRRTSRYSHELIVAFFFIAAFALIGATSSLSIAAFGFAIIAGGVWCNQLKEEYCDDQVLKNYARTIRNLHYAGGAAFIALEAAFLVRHQQTAMMPHIAICFAVLFGMWLAIYNLYPAYKHGSQVRGLVVNTLVPDMLLITIQERHKKE